MNNIQTFIAENGDKAEALAKLPDSDNPYLMNIKNTATQLVKHNCGEYTYLTQWSSGTCMWAPNERKIKTVESTYDEST